MSDQELAELYAQLLELEASLRSSATFAQQFADFDTRWGPAGTGARNALRFAQDAALRCILAVGDVRRNERRSAAA